MSQQLLVGVDLSGTQIRACLADAEGNILRQARQPTLAKEGLQPVLGRMKATIREVMEGARAGEVKAIGIASPGPLNPRTGVVVAPCNLPGWDKVPLAEIMRQEFGVPVYVNNDANLAGWAEFCYGAGKGSRDLVYLTISTGIGGGIICDGRLLMGAHGYAGEPGHITVDPEGPRCNCGNIGCLEAMSSGPAIARRATEWIRKGQESSWPRRYTAGQN